MGEVIDSSPDPLMKFVKKAFLSFLKNIKIFKENVDLSKISIKYLTDQIREQGHVHITNETHNVDKSLDKNMEMADVIYAMSPDNQTWEKFYPIHRIDRTFDRKHRKDILSQDKNFQKKMDSSIRESFYRDFNENTVWKVADYLNTSQYLDRIVHTFHAIYHRRKKNNVLDTTFTVNKNPSQFVINGKILDPDNTKNFLQDVETLIPDRDYQKLIATYANQRILNETFSRLSAAFPALQKYNFTKSKNIYKIDTLDDGLMKIVVTNISDLHAKNKKLDQEYHSCGVRATIIVSPTNVPIIKYSHFVE